MKEDLYDFLSKRERIVHGHVVLDLESGLEEFSSDDSSYEMRHEPVSVLASSRRRRSRGMRASLSNEWYTTPSKYTSLRGVSSNAKYSIAASLNTSPSSSDENCRSHPHYGHDVVTSKKAGTRIHDWRAAWSALNGGTEGGSGSSSPASLSATDIVAAANPRCHKYLPAHLHKQRHPPSPSHAETPFEVLREVGREYCHTPPRGKSGETDALTLGWSELPSRVNLNLSTHREGSVLDLKRRIRRAEKTLGKDRTQFSQHRRITFSDEGFTSDEFCDARLWKNLLSDEDVEAALPDRLRRKAREYDSYVPSSYHGPSPTRHRVQTHGASISPIRTHAKRPLITLLNDSLSPPVVHPPPRQNQGYRSELSASRTRRVHHDSDSPSAREVARESQSFLTVSDPDLSSDSSSVPSSIEHTGPLSNLRKYGSEYVSRRRRRRIRTRGREKTDMVSLHEEDTQRLSEVFEQGSSPGRLEGARLTTSLPPASMRRREQNGRSDIGDRVPRTIASTNCVADATCQTSYLRGTSNSHSFLCQGTQTRDNPLPDSRERGGNNEEGFNFSTDRFHGLTHSDEGKAVDSRGCGGHEKREKGAQDSFETSRHRMTQPVYGSEAEWEKHGEYTPATFEGTQQSDISGKYNSRDFDATDWSLFVHPPLSPVRVKQQSGDNSASDGVGTNPTGSNDAVNDAISSFRREADCTDASGPSTRQGKYRNKKSRVATEERRSVRKGEQLSSIDRARRNTQRGDARGSATANRGARGSASGKGKKRVKSNQSDSPGIADAPRLDNPAHDCEEVNQSDEAQRSTGQHPWLSAAHSHPANLVKACYDDRSGMGRRYHSCLSEDVRLPQYKDRSSFVGDIPDNTPTGSLNLQTTTRNHGRSYRIEPVHGTAPYSAPRRSHVYFNLESERKSRRLHQHRWQHGADCPEYDNLSDGGKYPYPLIHHHHTTAGCSHSDCDASCCNCPHCGATCPGCCYSNDPACDFPYSPKAQFSTGKGNGACSDDERPRRRHRRARVRKTKSEEFNIPSSPQRCSCRREWQPPHFTWATASWLAKLGIDSSKMPRPQATVCSWNLGKLDRGEDKLPPSHVDYIRGKYNKIF
eukprot:Rmarinus@m.22571